MSSSLEVQAKAGYGSRYNEEEAASLVESGHAPSAQTSQQQAPKAAYSDDEGVLPVILEDYLERVGVM